MKISGVVVQAWQTASKDVFHRMALRCLEKLYADSKNVDLESELAPLGCLIWALGQARDAVTLQAAVQAGAGELWDTVPQAAENVVERQEGPAAEFDDLLRSAAISTRRARSEGLRLMEIPVSIPQTRTAITSGVAADGRLLKASADAVTNV